MEGVVTLTPSRPEALVTVDDQQLHQTMVLQHGNVVRFANTYTYRFCDPKVEDPVSNSGIVVKYKSTQWLVGSSALSLNALVFYCVLLCCEDQIW